MSLVVTSNIATEDDPSFSNVFKPFSYQNRLLNTMRIPPMSEIALQSAKINKNGLFILDRANSGFCHYFGTPIEDLHVKHLGRETKRMKSILMTWREKLKRVWIKQHFTLH